MATHRVFGLFPLSYFYRDRKATRLGKAFSHFWAAWSAIGLPSYGMAELELTGRKTGKPHRLAVVVVTMGGERYLVSMLGECEWVRNARANPKAAFRKFRRHHITLEEVPISARAPIIQEYVRRAPGGRPHIGLPANASLAACAGIASNHPVFKIVGGWT